MNKDRVINELLKRISDLEYEVERLEMMLEAEIEKNISKENKKHGKVLQVNNR